MNYCSKMCIVQILIIMSYSDLLLEKNLDSNSTFLNTSQHNDGRQIYEYGHHVKWLCFNTLEECVCCQIKEVHCFESRPALPFGYCATYSESNSLSIAKCPYYEWSKYNVTTPGYISLPVLLGILQNLDSGLWTGPWTGLWTGLVTTIFLSIKQAALDNSLQNP